MKSQKIAQKNYRDRLKEQGLTQIQFFMTKETKDKLYVHLERIEGAKAYRFERLMKKSLATTAKR